MRRFLSAFLLNLCLAAAAHAASIWFSDGQGLHRIDTASGTVDAAIPQDGTVALVLNQKDGALWALTSGRLRKYEAAGAVRVDLDLKTLASNFNAARRLALDPSDDSVWVAGGNNAFHLDADGHVLGGVASQAVVQDIALTQDQTLWVLGRNELARYSPQGALLGRDSLTGGLQQAAFIAADDANGVLWLAGSKTVTQVAPALPVSVRLAITTPETVSAIALDAGTGNLWVAGQSTLFAYSKDGNPGASTALGAPGFGNLQVLDFDAQSQSLWLGHEKGISRFDAAGRYLATLPASVRVDAISAAPSGIVPIVTLLSPTDGTLTRNPFEPIRLRYDASCFGQPCGFPSSVFAAYSLTATLDGQPIGGAFQFDAATNTATFTPATRLPEGLNTFSAFVTDASGRRSKTVNAQFTVDSIAPRFVNVTPADGSVFIAPGITLQGGLDDATARVTLESFSGAIVNGANPQGAAFSYGITLQPGSNAFRLTASDPAGNTTQLPLTYIFSTLSLTITSPADGAVVEDNKVTVSGTFSGASTATITVNGVPATVSGTSFTAPDVPLVFGPNTLTATGVTPQGAQATRSVTVTSNAPSITITSPAAGANVQTNSALVRGHIQAAADSGVVVNNALAYVGANGDFFANGVSLAPGANVLTATVTTPSGKSVSTNVAVSSTGGSPLIVSGTPTQGAAPLTVSFFLQNLAGLPLTSFQFNPGGPGSSGAAQPGALFAFTYPQPGVYLSVVSVFDAAGNRYDQPIAINVQDAAQLDQTFRALWNGMNNALLAGDKAKALTFLSPAAQEKYDRVFQQLMPNMAVIIGSYSQLQRVSLSPTIAEYAINRTIDGVNRIFLVYFVQDENGVWHIDAM